MNADNIPLLGSGKFILTMPDGAETELKYTAAQITPKEEPQTYAEECRYITPVPQLPEISVELQPCPEFDAWLQGMVQSYNAWMQQKIHEYILEIGNWAMENHPEWCRIIRRTKKGRTRKKYAMRILRAYREELARHD